MEIVKGDEYLLPLTISFEDEAITEDNVTAVRVTLSGYEAEWPNGTLSFSDGFWLFPMTQQMSRSFKGREIYYQVQIKKDGNIYSSMITNHKAFETLFRKEW